MVHSFDPKYWNGTIFLFKEWRMAGDTLEFRQNNQPIPASYFPRSLTIERASAALPDLFHTYRGSIVVSERARAVIEKIAPGQVEFIPVAIKKAPTTWLNPLVDAFYSIRDLGRAIKATFASVPFYPVRLDPMPRMTLRLNLASAYYFINVLGRAQRFQWLDMPTQEYPAREDGTVPHLVLHDRATWKLRWRAPSEPLIWRDTRWKVENRDYTNHTRSLLKMFFGKSWMPGFPVS